MPDSENVSSNNPTQSLRSELISNILNHPDVPERHKTDIPKLHRIVKSLETIAQMLGRENENLRPIATVIVDQAIGTAAAHAHGDEAFAQLMRDYVIQQSELAADDADPHVFVCHSTLDKPFARKLATDLVLQGYRVWFDEWEMQVGDSLYDKIQNALKSSFWFLVVLSPNSVESKWCKRELHNALSEEDAKERVFVLPVLYQDCEIPGFLKEKFWADCREGHYDKGLSQVTRRLSTVLS